MKASDQSGASFFREAEILFVHTFDRSVTIVYIDAMNFTQGLFNLIKKTGELASEIAISYQEEMKVSRSAYYGSLIRLGKRGLIQKQIKQKQISYTLTDKGRKYNFPKRQIQEKRTDGYSTVIIFDIPETMRRQRTIFRRYLVRIGYTQLQKSVLIAPNKFSKDIIDLVKELKIRPYLTVLSSKVYYF